jgi:hypothetical protein
MIVSHRHRFIYLRTEKTASTSLTDALKAVLGPEDKVYRSFTGKWVKMIGFNPGGLKRSFPGVFGLHFHAHAADVRRILGPDVFDSYYKFAVERNPWERQLSLYTHRIHRKGGKGKTVEEFDQDMRNPLWRLMHYSRLRNWDIYSIGNEVVADKVLRYENLRDDLQSVFDHLGIDEAVQLPVLNARHGGDRQHYSTYYSDATRDLVGRWYAREIAAFNYTFEDQRRAPVPGGAKNPITH